MGLRACHTKLLYLLTVMSRGQRSGAFSTVFHKGNNFTDVLFAFLHIKHLLISFRKDLGVFPFRVDLPALLTYPFPLICMTICD